MKFISFCVPCYNMANYMRKCIDSLLVCGEDAEIIIVDDGSTKDNTPEIADEYGKKYPNIVKVIHQENGGHGEGVNQGIRNATGLYFKIVDADDWADQDSLSKLLEKIKQMQKDNHLIDMLICNYVYEYTDGTKCRIVDYKNVLPVEKEFSFAETKKFKKSQFITMHSAIYRTKILQDIALTLPKHTFYVDNIFVYTPLPYVKSFYYINADLYRYYVGRADQSINEDVIMKRIDQHIKVTKIVIDTNNIRELEKQNKKLAKYMTNFVSILMAITSIYLIKIGDKEALTKKKELWEYLKTKDKKLWSDCKHHAEGLVSTNSKFGMGLCKIIYTIARKVIKFN